MRNFGYMEKDRETSLGDLRIWRRILRHSRGYAVAIGGAVLLSLVVTGGTLGLPLLIKTGIDRYITASTLDNAARLDGLWSVGVIFGLLTLIVFGVTFVQVVLLEWVGQSVMHRIRQQLFGHILKLDLAFLDRQPTGRLVTRLTNDVQNMHEMFTSVMVTLFNDLLRLAGILVVLFLMNPRLALLMAVFVPISLLTTILFARLAREKFRAIRSQLSRMNTYIQEAVSGIAIIQLFGRQQSSAAGFASLSREYLGRTLSQIKLFSFFMPLTELFSSVAIALILWYGGSEVLKERLTIGELVAFLAYMRLFFQPLRELSQKYSIVQSALASAERIFHLLDTRFEIVEPAVPEQPAGTRGRVEFHQVSFSYTGDQPVLEAVSFTVEPGETVAIVGTTGSGKTTLISLLLRFYDPQQGRIAIDGVDIRRQPLEQLRTLVGVVLQDVFILQDTLLANIGLNSGRTRSEVEKILHSTGMTRFVDTLPSGLDTLIGEGGHELSTGEKQLLAFARALCRNPAVLVLDEATASIDSVTESILEEAVADSFSERTSIVIAHRLSTIRRADRILVMDHGRIVEQGTHQELLARGGRYARLIRLDLLKPSEAAETGSSPSPATG